MSNQNELQEAIGKIIEMATNDEDLKNDLVSNTKATLSVFGIDVDDDVKFVFTNGEKVEADDSTIVIDLGGAEEEEEMDLEESSLENVTGGAGGIFGGALKSLFGKIRGIKSNTADGFEKPSSPNDDGHPNFGGDDNLMATRFAAFENTGSWKEFSQGFGDGHHVEGEDVRGNFADDFARDGGDEGENREDDKLEKEGKGVQGVDDLEDDGRIEDPSSPPKISDDSEPENTGYQAASNVFDPEFSPDNNDNAESYDKDDDGNAESHDKDDNDRNPDFTNRGAQS